MPRRQLTQGWQIAPAEPGTVCAPDDPAFESLGWVCAESLGTVASILRHNGLWRMDLPRRFDAQDWWYRIAFEWPSGTSTSTDPLLGFDGLATRTDVWLNGVHLLFSPSMFIAHVVPAHGARPGTNTLVLRCQSLDAHLAQRRPKPRWRAPLVEHQQLRWIRTTLLGRLPGWSPPVAAVGPWRPIWLEAGDAVRVEARRLRSSVHDHHGEVQLTCCLRAPAGQHVSNVELRVSRGHVARSVLMRQTAEAGVFSARIQMDQVDLWWPHTHGDPALYEVRVIVHLHGGSSDAADFLVGRVGFRTVSIEHAAGDFAVMVNGERIFCRGACWTPVDVVTLQTTPNEADTALRQLVDAGVNMVRVGGTMVYETDAFFDACDAHGVLVWQDFMFANMDYPEGDAQFVATVLDECQQQLERIAMRPCLALVCGNSEVSQQAAMCGARREAWTPALFETRLAACVAQIAPHLAYWPSSAYGGAFPHQPNAGTASYYGVGAYLKPLADARRADLRFASECLGFANVPEQEMLESASGAGTLRVNSVLWKARVPRDSGASWDFDDVRDHYLREIFDEDPGALRYADPERYLQLSRAASAEAMSAAFREWRRAGSTCNGALIWFLRDLWPGAGWGIVDASGVPKAPYYALKRMLQPRAVLLCDEGGSGLLGHIVNEASTSLAATLEVLLLPVGSSLTRRRLLSVQVPARTTVAVPIAECLEGFEDLSYAYRFGPAPYEAVVLNLLDATGQRTAQDVHFPLGHRQMHQEDLGLTATLQRRSDADAVLEVTTQKLARFVTVRVPGYRAQDQYFHVTPAVPHCVPLRRQDGRSGTLGEVTALNARFRKVFSIE